ncbi:MAG: hypothetical protein ACLFU8_02065 [Anaerolineales bacterium]
MEERRLSLLDELRTLLWLQWRLTRAIFRSRRLSDRVQIVRYLLLAVQFVFTVPLFFVMGAGLALLLAFLLTPAAAVEAAMVVNTFIFFIWLLLPASYSSQIVERFEMSRLFAYPMSFRGVVVGSTLISLLTVTGLWTVPMLMGEIVGLAYHAPLTFPLVLLGALPLFALLVLSGRIIEDLFDLVAADRRLRALMLFLATLPFLLLWLGQYVVQLAPELTDELPAFMVPLLEQLEAATSFSEVLEILEPSRYLLWLPTGWATGAMGFVVTGEWGRWALFFALSFAFVGALFFIHAQVTRRLVEGAALTIGPQRVRRRAARRSLPGPPVLWGLIQKDLIYLQRSPMPRRMFFSGIIMLLVMGVSLIQIPMDEMPLGLQSVFAGGVSGGIVLLLSFMMNMVLLGNYFGTIDREGFGTLAHSGVDRRYVLLAATLVMSLFILLEYAVVLLIVGLLTGNWSILPLGLYFGLCLQFGGAPAYLFASLIGPYRTQLKFSRGVRRQGNLWGFLAFGVSALPLILLVGLPYFFWKPGLIVTLPLAGIYSGALFVLLLKPLARFMQRREYQILEAVTSEG